jgi:hypothetical protein
VPGIVTMMLVPSTTTLRGSSNIRTTKQESPAAGSCAGLKVGEIGWGYRVDPSQTELNNKMRNRSEMFRKGNGAPTEPPARRY